MLHLLSVAAADFHRPTAHGTHWVAAATVVMAPAPQLVQLAWPVVLEKKPAGLRGWRVGWGGEVSKEQVKRGDGEADWPECSGRCKRARPARWRPPFYSPGAAELGTRGLGVAASGAGGAGLGGGVLGRAGLAGGGARLAGRALGGAGGGVGASRAGNALIARGQRLAVRACRARGKRGEANALGGWGARGAWRAHRCRPCPYHQCHPSIHPHPKTHRRGRQCRQWRQWHC